MSIEETYDVINRFNKSLSKSLLKPRPKHPEDLDSVQIESVILDSRFPRKRVHYDNKEVSIEDKDKATYSNQALNLIQINVNEDNVNIRDTVMWDSGDTAGELTLQFADGMVRDFLEEKRIEFTTEKINSKKRKFSKCLNLARFRSCKQNPRSNKQASRDFK